MKKSIDGTVMEMIPIGTKMLETVGYDEEKRVLAIEFTRGPVYVYSEVPKDVFEEQLAAPSPDDFFSEKIKNGFANKRVW